MISIFFRNTISGSLILLLFVAELAAAAGVESHHAKLLSGSRYYFDSFNPEPTPWIPGAPLNIEEVFKNYQYVEIVPDHDGKAITVNQYIQGSKKGSTRYRIAPDGGLQKEE